MINYRELVQSFANWPYHSIPTVVTLSIAAFTLLATLTLLLADAVRSHIKQVNRQLVRPCSALGPSIQLFQFF